MTFGSWLNEIEARLSCVNENERAGILNYYRELYGDKSDAGLSDEAILSEFGTLDECIERIKQESPELFENERTCVPFKKIATHIALLLFVGLPAALSALSALAALAVCTLGGAGTCLGGVAVVIYSIALLFGGAGANTVLIQFGIGLAMTGAGVMICIGFFFMTKYAIASLNKIVKYVYQLKKGGRI